MSKVELFTIDKKTKEVVVEGDLTGSKFTRNVKILKLESDKDLNKVATIHKRASSGKVFWSAISDSPITVDVPIEHINEVIGHKFKTNVSKEKFGTVEYYVLG